MRTENPIVNRRQLAELVQDRQDQEGRFACSHKQGIDLLHGTFIHVRTNMKIDPTHQDCYLLLHPCPCYDSY